MSDVDSLISGHSENSISALAGRTAAVAKKLADGEAEEETRTVATLGGAVAGLWELDTGIGRQWLDFSKGYIEFADEEIEPYILSAASYSHPHLKFTFPVDKGGYELELEFEGTVSGDTLEGAFFPFDAPVKGKRVEQTQTD